MPVNQTGRRVYPAQLAKATVVKFGFCETFPLLPETGMRNKRKTVERIQNNAELYGENISDLEMPITTHQVLFVCVYEATAKATQTRGRSFHLQRPFGRRWFFGGTKATDDLL